MFWEGTEEGAKGGEQQPRPSTIRREEGDLDG